MQTHVRYIARFSAFSQEKQVETPDFARRSDSGSYVKQAGSGQEDWWGEAPERLKDVNESAGKAKPLVWLDRNVRRAGGPVLRPRKSSQTRGSACASA